MSRSNPSIKELVQGFAKNIKQLKAPEYKESSLRLHYLDPFWNLLGWDVSNEEQRPLLDAEVVIEPSMDTVESEGIRSRKPDYLFRVNSFSRFIVGAKKRSVDIQSDVGPAFQFCRYAWTATSRSLSSPILMNSRFTQPNLRSYPAFCTGTVHTSSISGYSSRDETKVNQRG